MPGSAKKRQTTGEVEEDDDIKPATLLQNGMESIMAAHALIQASAKELDVKIAKWEAFRLQMKVEGQKAATKIKLNVGGSIFTTRKETLMSKEDTHFWAMRVE
jgi:ribosomal 30S subunit maturation factor RimM